MSLALVVLSAAAVTCSDVVDVGETAEEALLGLDDDQDASVGAIANQQSGHDVVELGEGIGIATEDQNPQFPIDLNNVGNEDVVKPREIDARLSLNPGQEAKTQLAEDAMVKALKDAQDDAIEAEVKAEAKEKEADEQKRLATVKDEKPKRAVLAREGKLRKEAVAKRKKADALAKKAYALKLDLKEQVKTMIQKNTEDYSKAHFAATEAEVGRAQALTEAAIARKPKITPLNPCDITFESTAATCKNATKTDEAKAGTDDEVNPVMIKEKEKSCLNTASEVKVNCKKAHVAELSMNSAADHTMSELTKAFNAKHHAETLARAMALYKDVEKPKKPDGPVGLFQFKGLVYMANKDGTRTWVQYPTYKCHRATAGVVPQQFPESAELPIADKKKSETMCQMGVYKGMGNPDFYENCECSGAVNKKSHGGFCDKWGYKFNWCYVVMDCAYGNTAYSDEIQDTKVLVGCRIHPPTIEP